MSPRRPPLVAPALAVSCLCSTLAAGDPPPPPAHPTVPSTEAVDRFTTTREGRWLDLPVPEDTFTFVVYGDRTGGPAAGVEILAQAVEETNLFEPDLVMTVGDLIQGYGTIDPWMDQMREYREIMDRLHCPWFPVAGNHDVYWRGPDRPPEEHEGRYETHFGPLWYAFDHKDCRFIVLYTDEPDPETGERNFGKPACQRMSPEQLAWLETTLDASRDRRHVFVFLHHPRWIGGRYGDDWTRVHAALAEPGNVRAVFAGHIHHMRYDGRRDGIEYMTLATVGGGQAGHAPEAGWLHQFHHVTVRPDGIALAAIPIGTTMDVRDVTPEVSTGAALLARTRHRDHGRIEVAGDGAAEGEVGWTIVNPTNLPMEIELVPGSADLDWTFGPDHHHAVIEPGGRHRVDVVASRPATGATAWPAPSVTLSCDLLGPSRRFPMTPRALRVPLVPTFDAPEASGAARVLELDGRGDAALVEAETYDLPDGPLTLEVWFQGDRFDGRTGLATRTEDSEFGIFVSDGTPDFSVHLDAAYATVRGAPGTLEPGRWHHLAGVFDGSEMRLYLDGRRLASIPASGVRTRNRLPFVVGGDVTRRGEATSCFDGRIDSVRLSRVARYDGEVFEPTRSWAADEDTVLLLDFDDRTGPWSWDRSSSGAHPRMTGDASLVEPD